MLRPIEQDSHFMRVYKANIGWMLPLCACALAGCGGTPRLDAENGAEPAPLSREERETVALKAELHAMLALLRDGAYDPFFRQYVDPGTVARLQLLSTSDFFVEFAASPMADEMRASIERALEQDPVFSENYTAVAFRGGDGLPNLKLRKLDQRWRIID